MLNAKLLQDARAIADEQAKNALDIMGSQQNKRIQYLLQDLWSRQDSVLKHLRQTSSFSIGDRVYDRCFISPLDITSQRIQRIESFIEDRKQVIGNGNEED